MVYNGITEARTPPAAYHEKRRKQAMFTALLNNLKANRRTIVFTEGPDARIQEAAARLIKEDLMNVILVGNVDEVDRKSVV